MGYIKDETIQRVFQTATVLDVVEQFGEIQLKKEGRNFRGLSPFSQEKTPSFYVVPSKDLWKDFSSGKGGKALEFLREYKRLDFKEAIEWLADFYNIEVEYEQVDEGFQQKRQNLGDIIKAAHHSYQKALFELPENHPAKIYVNSRFSEDEILGWGLGYAPDSWDFLKSKMVEKGCLSEGIEAGLIAEKNSKQFDFFRNRIIIPIRNHRGDVVSFGGRVYEGGGFSDKDPKYMNGKETPLFNKSITLFGLDKAMKAIHEKNEVIVMEGYTDVMAFHNEGIMNVVGCLGTALTEDGVKILKRHSENITLCFDGDSAGFRAAQRSLIEILSQGARCFIIPMDEGDDPDSLIKKLNQPEPEPETLTAE